MAVCQVVVLLCAIFAIVHCDCETTRCPRGTTCGCGEGSSRRCCPYSEQLEYLDWQIKTNIIKVCVWMAVLIIIIVMACRKCRKTSMEKVNQDLAGRTGGPEMAPVPQARNIFADKSQYSTEYPHNQCMS